MNEVTNIITIEVTAITKGEKENIEKIVRDEIKNLPTIDDAVVIKSKKFISEKPRKTVKVEKKVRKDKNSK